MSGDVFDYVWPAMLLFAGAWLFWPSLQRWLSPQPLPATFFVPSPPPPPPPKPVDIRFAPDQRPRIHRIIDSCWDEQGIDEGDPTALASAAIRALENWQRYVADGHPQGE
jgi:hypothetical protein